jgi:predicted phosphodiesterase
MRFLIISDIHSNLEALASVFSDLCNNSEKIDSVLVLGDIVGYGVNPNECCTIIRFLIGGNPSLKNEIQTIIQSIDIDETDKKNIIDYIYSLGNKAIVIAGNHDQRVIGELNSAMASAAGISINWTKKIIHEDNISLLNILRTRQKLWKYGIELVHSTPACPEDYEYVMNSASLSYAALHSKITFAGHTHKPAAYLYKKQERDSSVLVPADRIDKRLMSDGSKSTEDVESFEVYLSPVHRYYINPGSVGQPRDGIPMASYKIYDTVTEKIFLEKSAYDIARVKTKVLEAGFPYDLAHRIESGI